jgi:perosamine synthetase
MPADAQPSRFVFVVRLHETISRNHVIADLRDKGVPTRTYFSPIHLQPFFMERFGYREGDLPVTERVANSTLALPFHANMPLVDMSMSCKSSKNRLPGARIDHAARLLRAPRC